MQMRSWAVWLGVFSLVAIASPAWAAPKKGKKAADEAPEAKPAPAESNKPADVDSLMEESTKRKSAPKVSSSDSPSEAPAADQEKVGEPDAWERPPAEEEKPKKVAVAGPVAPSGDGRNKDVRLMVGYGFSTTNSFFGAADPYGLGFGLRGGYELDWHLVLGVGFEYFIGHATDPATDPVSGTNRPSTRAHYMIAHAEVGYNVWFGTEIILRPSLWAGASIGTQSPPGLSGTSGVTTALSLSPGLDFDYITGSTGWFVSAQGRINMILGQGESGIILLGAFGKRI